MRFSGSAENFVLTVERGSLGAKLLSGHQLLLTFAQLRRDNCLPPSGLKGRDCGRDLRAPRAISAAIAIPFQSAKVICRFVDMFTAFQTETLI